MSTVTLHHRGGTETTIDDPEFIDTLCNLNEVAVDGERYEDVDQVTFQQ